MIIHYKDTSFYLPGEVGSDLLAGSTVRGVLTFSANFKFT